MKSALKKERKSIAILTAAVIVFLAVSAAAVYLSVNADTAGPGGEMPRVDEVIIPDPEPPLAYFEPEPEASPEPEPEFVAASAWTPDADTLARAAELLSAMTDEEKLYQMLFVTPEALTGYTRVYQAGQATRIALEKYPVGGIVYFERNIDSPEQTREMLTKTQEMAKIPMFLGVDEEGGRVARISSQSAMGYDALPPMAELGASGDSAKAYDAGAQIGAMLVSLGFNMDFAPVADVLTNPENTEIGDRAFSSSASLTAEMAARFVSGLRETGVAATLKHFPGHGGAYGDSHDGYAESARTLDELRETELLPFVAGIDAGADFVMVSHISLPGIDPSGAPSSLSSAVVTDLLRNTLGFGRIIITDALDMGAVTTMYTEAEAAVSAVRAGADMLLMPQEPEAVAAALKSAVETGELTGERIDESVLRILCVKIERGIIA